MTESTIYPLLRRLTKEGYCETYMKELTEGPQRKYYRITNSERENLIKMVQDWKIFIEQVITF